MNIDKTVRVRVVHLDPGRVEGEEKTYTINADNTVQQVVQAMYPAFPGACKWVTLRTPGVYDREELWDDTQDSRAFFDRDFYATVSSGDYIEIYVCLRKPDGPSHDVSDSRLPAPGPNTATLLARLARLA